MHGYCLRNDEPPNHPFYLTSIPLPFIIGAQISLIIHSFIHCKDLLKIPKVFSSLYIFTLLSGLIWIVADFLQYVILPLSFQDYIFNHLFCGVIAYFDKLILLLFELSVVIQLHLRLQLTFANTVFALSNKDKILILTVLILPSACLGSIFVAFLSPICWRLWKPMDIHKNIYICSAAYDFSISKYVAYIHVLLLLVMKLTFGLLFSVKLKKLIGESSCADKSNTEVKTVMVKNTILTAILCGSTLFLWILFFVSVSETWLWIDTFLNCLCLGLMYRFNDNLYHNVFCKLCHHYFMQNHQKLNPFMQIQNNKKKGNDIDWKNDNDIDCNNKNDDYDNQDPKNVNNDDHKSNNDKNKIKETSVNTEHVITAYIGANRRKSEVELSVIQFAVDSGDSSSNDEFLALSDWIGGELKEQKNQ